MLNKLILAAAFFAPAAHALTQTNLPVVCGNSSEFVKVLEEHKEEIMFVGIDKQQKVDGLTINIFLNTKTRTYSAFLVANNADAICVISFGAEGKLIFKD